MHTDLPEAQKVLLFLEDWKWEHDPVCLLRRNQCLAILLHPWRDLEITEETGGFIFMAGKGMDVATQGLQNATTDLSDAVTAAENARMKTEGEDANEQEGHSSTSPSSRIPAPDLEKDLPNTQLQPANPKSEDENAVMGGPTSCSAKEHFPTPIDSCTRDIPTNYARMVMDVCRFIKPVDRAALASAHPQARVHRAPS
jgi:hypothetical protein